MHGGWKAPAFHRRGDCTPISSHHCIRAARTAVVRWPTLHPLRSDHANAATPQCCELSQCNARSGGTFRRCATWGMSTGSASLGGTESHDGAVSCAISTLVSSECARLSHSRNRCRHARPIASHATLQVSLCHAVRGFPCGVAVPWSIMLKIHPRAPTLPLPRSYSQLRGSLHPAACFAPKKNT